MFITLLSSLSSRIRDAALESLQAALPVSALLRCDLIDAQTLSVRVHRPGRAPEIHFVPVGRGCPAEAAAAAAVRILLETGRVEMGPAVAPRAAVSRIEGEQMKGDQAAADAADGVPGCVVIGLPPGVNGLAAHRTLVARSVGLPLAVDSVALAVDPAAVEPALVSSYPLHRAGLLPKAAGIVRSDDFMALALAHADTVLATDDPLWGSLEGGARADYRTASDRGLRLLRERAPHAVVNAPGRVSVLGRFDREAAGARMLAGAVSAKTAPGFPGPAGFLG